LNILYTEMLRRPRHFYKTLLQLLNLVCLIFTNPGIDQQVHGTNSISNTVDWEAFFTPNLYATVF